jgi:metallo-beta-lactamase family protein
MKAKLTFYGGVGSTTGANIMFEYANKKILVDCGLLQGTRFAEEKNFEPFGYDPSKVDFLLVTHAHMDHIGRIPKLVKEGFQGKIISTLATKELALPMLQDAIRVMSIRHKDKDLFDESHINRALELWEGRKYNEPVVLFEDCSLEMINAGHILGSAIIKVFYGKGDDQRSIAFTGDLGNSPSPLLPDSDFPKNVDYMVMESVYGDRNHESREERRTKLKEAILEGIKKDGTILIPAFSIERTQVLLYEINNMIEDKEIREIPVFLDSPLASKVTNIYKKYQSEFKESVKKEIKEGDDIFDFPKLHIVGKHSESSSIENIKGAKIILAGSGMSEGGRVVNHEAYYLPDPNATIVLVGYQSVGSLGRKIYEGEREVSINGKKVKVKATVKSIMGYSSHKDSDHLVEFVEEASRSEASEDGERSRTMRLKKVFVIMGEPKSSLFLAQQIRDYVEVEAIYPEEAKEYELS